MLLVALLTLGNLTVSAQSHSLQLFNTNNSPLTDDNARALALAPDSTLWIGTEYGLSTLKNNVWDTIDTLQGYQIRAIAFDSAGHAWVGTFLDGLWVQTDTGWINHTAANSLLPDDYVRTISFCPNADAWIGTAGGAINIHNGTWEVFRKANTNWYVEHITASYCTPSNNVWLGGLNTGLMHQIDTTWIIFRANSSNLPDNTILDIKGDISGNLILAMPAAGASVFDGNQGWINYNTASSFNPSNSINRVAVGTNGYLYFASVDKGLVVYKGGLDWFNISTSAMPDINGVFLPINEMLAAVQDTSGIIWASLANNGLARIEFIDSTISGIQGISSATVAIYPNPAADYVIIETAEPITYISITNLLGQVVYHNYANTPKIKIPLGDLPKGTYMVMLQSGSAITAQRLIKY